MAYDINLSKRFRQFRKKHIGSQYDASDLLKVSQKHISEIETGKVGIGLEIVRTLVKKLNLNANWFLTGVGNDVTNLEDKRKLIHDISDQMADIETIFTLIRDQDRKIRILASKLGTDKGQTGDK